MEVAAEGGTAAVSSSTASPTLNRLLPRDEDSSRLVPDRRFTLLPFRRSAGLRLVIAITTVHLLFRKKCSRSSEGQALHWDVVAGTLSGVEQHCIGDGSSGGHGAMVENRLAQMAWYVFYEFLREERAILQKKWTNELLNWKNRWVVVPGF